MLSRQELIYQIAMNSPEIVCFDFCELGGNLYEMDNNLVGMHSSHLSVTEKAALFEALAQNTNLRELRIHGCVSIELMEVLQCMTGLRSLNFSHAYFEGEEVKLTELRVATLKTTYCRFSLGQWLQLLHVNEASLRQYSSMNDISFNEGVLFGLNQCLLLESLQIERENRALGVLNVDILSQHPSLKKLELFGEIQFSEAGLQALQVQEFDIGIMPISATTLFALSDASQLEKLTLTAQSFSLDFIDTLISKRNIKHLGLIHCGIDDLFLLKIIALFKSHGIHLESLNLSHNLIVHGLGLDKLQVARLDLSLNRLSSFGLERIWHNRAIKQLNLNEVRLNYEDLGILKKETSITDLSVKGCNLSLHNLLEITMNPSIYHLNFAYQFFEGAMSLVEQELVKERVRENRRGAFRYFYVLKHLLASGILPDLPVLMIAEYTPCPEVIKCGLLTKQ